MATKFNRFRLLPGLPSVGEISQMSGNVTENIRHRIRDLPQELNALPSLFQNITEKLNTLPFLYAVTRNVSDTLDVVSHNITNSLRRERAQCNPRVCILSFSQIQCRMLRRTTI